MIQNVFDRLYNCVRAYDDYFILMKDFVGNIGFSGYQKVMASLRMLAYCTVADSWNEYLRMSETTWLEPMVRFATAVVKVFGAEYLWEPTAEDTAWLMALSEARGWPGILGSLNCMHWQWKNCPYALQGR
jgi:hypothetical protein